MCNFPHILYTCAAKNHVLMWSWNVLNCPNLCNETMRCTMRCLFTTIYASLQLSEISNRCEPLLTGPSILNTNIKHHLYLLQVRKLPYESNCAAHGTNCLNRTLAFGSFNPFNKSTHAKVFIHFSVAVIHQKRNRMNHTSKTITSFKQLKVWSQINKPVEYAPFRIAHVKQRQI